MANATIFVAAPRPARVRALKLLWGLRRWPVIPVTLLLMVVVTGITATWISPYNPRHATLADRMLPPVWMGPTTALKTVVLEPGVGEKHTQITLEEAQGNGRPELAHGRHGGQEGDQLFRQG